MDSPQVGSPSAGGSPAAAAATPGVEGVDGMEVARRMVQAAEAAALAAQAATRAVEGVSRTSTDDSKQWWRLLPKPPTFEHTNRESEIAAWREWSWAFEQYVASIDAKFADDIEQRICELPTGSSDNGLVFDMRDSSPASFHGSVHAIYHYMVTL